MVRHEANEGDAYLAGSCLGVFLLHLNFHHIAGVLDDFRNVGLVPSANLSEEPLAKVDEASVHPELPEHPSACAERWLIWLDHAKRSVNGPEHEEDHEQVMGVPKSFKVGALRPVH